MFGILVHDHGLTTHTPLPPLWPKMELKKFITTVDKIITSGQILVFEVSKQPYQSARRLGSFANGATASLVAKNGTKKLSQPIKELRGSNLEFKLITLKPTTETYFETYLSRFGLAGLPMAVILDLKCPYLSRLRSYGAEIGRVY